MRTLQELYKQIEDVADFSDIKVTDPNTLGLFSNRPLHVAAVWGDCEAIKMLVDAGAAINQPGEHGFTPLMEAVGQGHVDAVRLLIQLGAKPIKNDDGQLPSEYAELGSDKSLAQYLTESGF
jgi:ankyrin repeat protein